MRPPAVVLALLALVLPVAASGQVFGTFPWQMQPYCNVVTLTLTNSPAGWTLDGVDDQCGAVHKASAVGVASFSANGSVTLSFTIVTAPGGKPVHVSAVVSPANGDGTWTDSVGNTGAFAFFARTQGLPARPLPVSGLGAATVTTTEIAPGAVGASDINTAEVQARVTGTCSGGRPVTGVNANGTVSCGPAWNTIPSGTTVSGNIVWNGWVPTANSGATQALGVHLPGIAPAPFLSVGFSAGFLANVSTACTGSSSAPTAPPGRVCIYPFSYSGTLNTSVTGTFSAGGLPLDGRSFTIFFLPDPGLAAGTAMTFNGVWAYTAP